MQRNDWRATEIEMITEAHAAANQNKHLQFWVIKHNRDRMFLLHNERKTKTGQITEEETGWNT